MQQAAPMMEAARMPRAWGTYFSEEDYVADDRRAMLVHELTLLLSSSWLAERFQPHTLTGRHTLSVRLDELQKVCSSSDLYAALELQPLEALACLAASAHEVSPPDTLQQNVETCMQHVQSLLRASELC